MEAASAPIQGLRPRSPLGERLSDERLARMVAGGDERAFALIYERYHQTLYRYCRSIVRNDSDAQDGLQSALTSAFAALQRSQRNAPMKPWLFRIVHNEAMSLLRARRRSTLEEAAASERAEDSVEETAARRARVSQLLDDLALVSERPRAALLMRELNGLSHEEIGFALETSAAAARQAIFEARRALADYEEGRAMDCELVRRLLSDRDGRMLRRRTIQGHLRDCAGCRAFGEAIGLRTADFRAVVPVLPAAAAAAMLTRISQGAAAHAAAAHAAGAGLVGGTGASTGALSAGANGGAAATGAFSAGGGGAGVTAGGLTAFGGGIAAKVAAGAAVIAAAAGGVTGVRAVLDQARHAAAPAASPRGAHTARQARPGLGPAGHHRGRRASGSGASGSGVSGGAGTAERGDGPRRVGAGGGASEGPPGGIAGRGNSGTAAPSGHALTTAPRNHRAHGVPAHRTTSHGRSTQARTTGTKTALPHRHTSAPTTTGAAGHVTRPEPVTMTVPAAGAPAHGSTGTVSGQATVPGGAPDASRSSATGAASAH